MVNRAQYVYLLPNPNTTSSGLGSGVLAPGRNRSGLNTSGSWYALGSRAIAQMFGMTTEPLGMSMPVGTKVNNLHTSSLRVAHPDTHRHSPNRDSAAQQMELPDTTSILLCIAPPHTVAKFGRSTWASDPSQPCDRFQLGQTSALLGGGAPQERRKRSRRLSINEYKLIRYLVIL